MKTTSRTTLMFITAAAAVALGLAGCSAPAAPASTTAATTAPSTSAAPTPTETAAAGGDQSKAEACQILSASVSSIAADMQSSMTELQSDPDKALKTLDSLSDSMHDGLEDVTQADVHAAGEKAYKSLVKMTDAAKTIIKNPAKFDAAAYTKTISAVQTDFTAVGTTCNG